MAPHVERITHFDRWAHRVASASGAWRSRTALEETAFSQVRNDRAIVAAWIEREGEPTLAYPAGRALPEVTARRVRVPTLGPCEVATAPVLRGREPIDAVVVSLDHDGLRTTLALARADDAHEP